MIRLNQAGDTISAMQQWWRRSFASRYHTRSARFVGQNQQGDTIVEVVIAIAIISLVLVGAYVSVNKNTQTLQNTQERAMAQKLVASQIDALHAHGNIDPSKTCFSTTGAPQDLSSCTISGQAGSGADYKVSITQPLEKPPVQCNQNASQSPGEHVYTICAYWTSLGSQTNDDSNVTVYYAL